MKHTLTFVATLQFSPARYSWTAERVIYQTYLGIATMLGKRTVKATSLRTKTMVVNDHRRIGILLEQKYIDSKY